MHTSCGTLYGALACNPSGEGFSETQAEVVAQAIAKASAAAIIDATKSCSTTGNGEACVENDGWMEEAVYAVATAVRAHPD